ncbi:MAG: hypothetical protein ACSHXF_08765 [Aquaticitalea sp.]
MKKVLLLLLIIFTSNTIEAQFIKEKAINAQIGYGLSTPYYSLTDTSDDGFFFQGELVLKAYSWLDLRPYAGIILTSSNGKDINDNPTFEKATNRAALIGGKARVRAPIPWVAPYIELGIGASIGKFETFTYYTNIEKSGLIYHIPFSLGLELGREHNVDLGFTYCFQPSVEQFTGAFALGITVPLK